MMVTDGHHHLSPLTTTFHHSPPPSPSKQHTATTSHHVTVMATDGHHHLSPLTTTITVVATHCHNNDNDEGRGSRHIVSSPMFVLFLCHDDAERWGLRHVVSSPTHHRHPATTSMMTTGLETQIRLKPCICFIFNVFIIYIYYNSSVNLCCKLEYINSMQSPVVETRKGL